MSKGSKPLAAIVAMNHARVIGKDGDLPWRIKEDLKHFKNTTMGHVIIMGRKTHESIGKALPGRDNFVVSRRGLRFEGCTTFYSLDAAVDVAHDRDELPFIIGGAAIYEASFARVTHMYLTRVERDVAGGDTFFPRYDEGAWEQRESREGKEPGVTFELLTRR